MKYRLLFFLLSACGLTTQAQTPEDALRYSWLTQNGTARNMAIGGAMGSLGGEISSTFVNPAGLGFYKNSEFVFTPSFTMKRNKNDYRGTQSNSTKNGLGFGTTGFVFGGSNGRNSKSSSAFSIAVNQQANFNNNIGFSGLNNYSSFSEQFVEEFAGSGLSIAEALNVNSAVPYGAAPALYTYLIDTVTANGVTSIKAAPEYVLDQGYALKQDFSQITKGGLYEAAVGFATNQNDKWYFGGTIGIPFLHYESATSFTETDTSSSTANGFKSFTYQDNFKSTGAGLNLKLGLIYRPSDYVRFGLAVHTPSFMRITDERTTFLNTHLENPTDDFSASSTTFTSGQPGQSKYIALSPWKAIVSASYVFREEQNVDRQRGFVTADVEYVNHKGSRFKSDFETGSENSNYYSDLNNVIKNEYKGTFNARIGGELKFSVFMARLGFAYYGNPYNKDLNLKANKSLVSGGLGYRNHGFFVDVTYVHSNSKDVNFPYRLGDKNNTYANYKQQAGNVVATVGFKL